ncbi:M20/M25/M40 family metallo-hydrolase [Sphingomonas sp.]|jgi:glutamate carboxypeptidase|uniref:M20/M25/M40 family metallo-hydrolase n=1 Tax=Sphingomonas sp. TaxID=28214 RepID=UPI002D7F9359|nr:M20/M25/M40 family metallo-hydrolase [Sphingomonas sp.]HEU0043759.1 M20/M25/M40 family metallo-hydrolase [Sphingomonas sp.]
MRLALLTAALLLTAPALAADPSHERLRAAIEADTSRQEALLERLVNQNSGTLNAPGVRAVGDMLRAELEPLGFAVRWVDMTATGRSGHLIATHRGNKRGKRVLLIGHLDTVFEPSSPFARYTRTGDRAVGPGVGDDKGGLVVIVGALRAMQAAGTLKAANVTVVLTGDEERPGQPTATARADLIAAGKQADAALEYENLATEGGKEFGTVARRSGSAWELRTTGRTGHSSGVFNRSLGYGAIYEMARILDAFRRELPEPNATFNVGLVAGGTPATIDAGGSQVGATGKTNIVAAEAIARGDLRTLTPEQDTKLRDAMAKIVAQHLPGTTATMTFYDSTPAMAPSEGNRALLATLNTVNRELGLPEMPEFDPAKRGAADSGFVAADVPTLGGLGVAGGGAHAEGEWIDLKSLPRQALRSAALIGRLAGERRR